MSRLAELFDKHGQSPWLDNLRRGWITSGELEAWVQRGVRGLTSNPSIFATAIAGSADYDDEFRTAVGDGLDTETAYWQLVGSDIRAALGILAPVHEHSRGLDGYVSVEVDPSLARNSAATEAAARDLHSTLGAANLMVKIPGTAEGLAPISAMISEKRSINVTLIFSLRRYAEVIEAYLSGLEAAEGDLSGVSSVASFFLSRVDTEIDRRLDEIGTPAALALRGRAAVANARLAYGIFVRSFRGPRWETLSARGARLQRPLWASTSTKNPAYADTLYVDSVIGPHTVNTLPDATLEAFEHHGTLARTVDADPDSAQQVIDGLAELGIDMEDVTAKLEAEGVAAFEKSFGELLEVLDAKARSLS